MLCRDVPGAVRRILGARKDMAIKEGGPMIQRPKRLPSAARTHSDRPILPAGGYSHGQARTRVDREPVSDWHKSDPDELLPVRVDDWERE